MKKHDKHAFDVAGIVIQEREDTERIPALPRPERELPHDAADARESERLPAWETVHDEASFHAELQRWRDWAGPWLEDHTQASRAEARPTLDLREFDFRFETPEDLADAQRRYGDAGDWEPVTIPHYRGPTDKWQAYYRRTIAAADVPAGERVFLCFEAVDYTAEVFPQRSLHRAARRVLRALRV